MTSQFSLDEILTKAIQKEIGSRVFYLKLGPRMENKIAREAFEELARQEQGHQEILERYRRGEIKGGIPGRGETIDYKITEYLDQPEISPEMQLKDTFLLAANREKHSHELYLALAHIHPPGESKKLLESLASQELEHKRRVEFLYTEVAFPQTDGG